MSRFALIKESTDRNYPQAKVSFTRNRRQAEDWARIGSALISGDEESADEANYHHRWIYEAYEMPARWQRPTALGLSRTRETLVERIRRVGVPVDPPAEAAGEVAHG